jgi:hypothetical protein
MHRSVTHYALFLTALVVACGGASEYPPGSGGDGGSSGSGSSSGGSSGGGSGSSSGGQPVPGCPSVPPPNSAICTDPNLACQYGSDPDIACDTLSVCTPGNGESFWVTTTPVTTAGVCPTSRPGTAACPATYPASGQSCTATAECAYPEGLCTCSMFSAGSGFVFTCEDPGAGCPEPRPQPGTPCNDPNAEETCVYGDCDVAGEDLQLGCENGIWTVVGSGPCLFGGGSSGGPTMPN